jgi:uncharacterized damage-inducible protein DinB
MSEPMIPRSEVEARLELEWRSLLEELGKAAESVSSPTALPPNRRLPLSRVALFAQLEEVREDFRAIRNLVDEELSERFVNASWTLKDLLAHMASWAREFRSEVLKASRNESFDYVIPFAMSVLGPTEWNEVEVAARREQSVEQIFDEFERETAQLQDLVLELGEEALYGSREFPISPSGDPAARLKAPPAFIIMAKCLHDRHHVAQVRARLSRFRE